MTAETPVAWIDAGAGVAGDMLVAALIDAGADEQRVAGAVASLGLPGLGLRVSRDRRGGLGCRRVHVTEPVEATERHLAEVLALVARAELGERGHAFARDVFGLLARAEGAVHGADPAEVHFHEVGAHDALADVVGAAAALEDLGLLDPGALVRCSPLATGHGTVRARHGVLPVPGPAVVEIAAIAGLGLAGGELAGERTTPTGAALVASAARPGPFPAMTVRASGVGGGRRDPPDRPNVTRVVLGTAVAGPGPADGEVVLVEATVDDLDPQLWPSVLRAVRAAGAWDCWTTPVIGRHGRPGQVLTAVCDEAVRPAVVDRVFAHTTTLGVRWSRWERATLPRHIVEVDIGGPGAPCRIPVKIAEHGDGRRTAKPEPADVEAAAEALGVPAREVAARVVAALPPPDA
ncbi:nickel pincer cofactor biosynthesis protein LarC [Actinomycetospora chlora]|uniref:Pyridinium-3,5-bisthiocarboxylic acid mononucleotide nickel insertion protein n=1 Tax=Actinomycetospora chlora TaxID=663608 RepID=A0ABP9BFS8_9PSEU